MISAIENDQRNFAHELSSDPKNMLDDLIKQMQSKIEYIAKNEQIVFYDRPYRIDENKLGNKKFVARHHAFTKEWRHEMKELLRRYLTLKCSQEGEDLNIKALPDNPLLSEEIIRFRITNEGVPSLYELSESECERYYLLSYNKTAFRLSKEEALIFQEGVLTRIFQGSHLEKITYEHCEVKSDSFWSVWNTYLSAYSTAIAYLPLKAQKIIYKVGELLCSTTPAYDEYQKVIHPAFVELSLAILKECPEHQIRIVEICGGRGELAIKIAEQYKKPLDYYLLEYNDRSLQEASNSVLSASANGTIEGNIIPIKTDVTNRDDYFTDMQKNEAMQNESIDLIIGSGALTYSVIKDKETALQVAKKCHEILKPMGKMILAGHASSLLDSEDFASLGFEVINTFLAGSLYVPFSTVINHMMFTGGFKQFYVLEKK